MSIKRRALIFWSTCLGNLLEHYDTALYAILSPFLAPLFFSQHDELTALIFTYAIIPISMLLRPIGALFFGYIGDNYSRQQALLFSLMGMAVVTALMAFIPTYYQIGALAPILLATCKSLQTFFAAGEVVGGAVYLIENTEESKRNLFSSLYSASTVGGILLASLGVAYLNYIEFIEKGWRILYLLGFSTAIFGWILRVKLMTPTVTIRRSNEFYVRELIQALWLQRGAIFTIFVAAGFSYATYMIALVMLNGFIPLISSTTKAEMTVVSTLLLILDFLLMPLFGLLANKYSSEKLMIASSLASVLFGIPGFMLLENASIIGVGIIVAVFVVIGVCFSATLYAWSQQLIPKPMRYSILAFTYACGSQFLGGPTATFSLWIFQKTGIVSSVSWYWIFLGFLSAVMIAKRRSIVSIQCDRLSTYNKELEM